MFYDRREAGQKLAKRLNKYKDDKKAIILAIPRGGVAVAKETAKALNLPLALIIVRKLPMPDNPESGIGAISESGVLVWQPVKNFYPEFVVKKVLKEQKEEIKKRIKVLRKGKDLPNLAGKTVIIIDDGIAMGSTTGAAIKTVRNKGAKKIIVAVPVGGEEVIGKIRKMVDEFICLETPKEFYAVAQVYKNWYDLSDEEVIAILKDKNYR